jgi:hypothetical protein
VSTVRKANNGSSKALVPVIKLAEPMTYRPWEVIPVDSVVIKAREFFRQDGRATTPIFSRIVDAGGIHEYLGFDGSVILSSIMPDKMIFRITRESYVEVINKIGVDVYFTPDGENYLDRKNVSANEIKRMVEETGFLIDACNNSIPLGLVKGSDEKQIRGHISSLQKLGINSMIFHVSDFLSQGISRDIALYTKLIKVVREETDQLFVYSIGSRRNLRRFGFADGFITQNHFTNAFHRLQLVDGKWIPLKRKPIRADIMRNLKELYSEVYLLDAVDTKQKRLH